MIRNKNKNNKNKNFVWFVWFVVNIIFLASCTSTPRIDYAGLGNPSDLVPLSSRVITGTLPNGLRYYIMENSLPENRAHLGLIVHAGSVHERDDQRGFAHFVEHLAFSDTARFPDLQLQEYLRSLGMRFGPDFNANTSYDRTLYYFDIPVEEVNGVKRIPDRGLAILDDWTHGVTFKNEFVDSERRVILEEMRARSGADDRIRKILFPLLFAGSAYEDRDILGLEETIINSTQESLLEFYNRWYTSDNMAIVFIGDFDGRTLERELINHFTMPAPIQPVNRPVYELPPPVNGNFHVEILTDPEITAIEYSLHYKQNKPPQRGTLAAYRESIIDYLIYFMINQRFNEASLDPDSNSTGSWSGIFEWAGNSKFYLIGTSPKTGRTEEALFDLLAEIESMKRGYGFTESELHIAKLSLISYMERQLSEKDRQESRSYLYSLLGHFLYNNDFADIEWEVEAVNALLPGIGINEISEAARSYFINNDIIVLLTAPEAEAEGLPSEERIKNIFEQAAGMQITQRQDRNIANELVSGLPPRGMITNENTDNETGAVVIELSNGVKIILQETTNRNNEVTMYAMARGGFSNVPEEEIITARLLSEMIQVSGLGQYSKIELDNYLAGKQVSFSFWTSHYYRVLQGTSVTQDIKTLFEMIHLFFTNPRLDERAVSAMLDQYRTQLIYRLEDPETVFYNEITRIITNINPYFLPVELADISRVSMQYAQEQLNRFINPQDYTFIFTGNFDLEIIKEYLEIYLASIPPHSDGNNTILGHKISRPENIQRNIYKGQDDRSIVFLGWFSEGDNQFSEHRNQTSAVLNEYLDILLNDEIRERLGGVYGISAGSSVSVIPSGEYSLSVYFVCNPERVNELIEATIAALNNLINQPIDNNIFNQAKEAILMQHRRSMQRNLHVAQSYANSAVLYNTPLSRLNTRPEIINLVTMQDMQELCRQMLQNGVIRVVLYPEDRQ